MSWVPAPLERTPRPDEEIPFLHQCYTCTSSDVTDPTMVWSSQVDMTGIRTYLAMRNESSHALLTPTVVLARIVALALAKHPELNCRLMGQRIYRFTEQNILLPVLGHWGPTMVLLRKVDEMSYEDVAALLKQEVVNAMDRNRQRGLGERVFRRLPRFLHRFAVRSLLWVTNRFRLPLGPVSKHLDGAPVMVNYFGFPCAPPMVAYKPSRFGSRATLMNVTLGPPSQQPAVENDTVVIRPISGLFVRVDHRTSDARQLCRFVKTLVTMLENPAEYDRTEPASLPTV